MANRKVDPLKTPSVTTRLVLADVDQDNKVGDAFVDLLLAKHLRNEEEREYENS